MDKKITYRILALIFLVFLALSSQSQETTSRFVREQGGDFHLVDKIIGQFADSLNYWNPDQKLPSYLFDKDLDFNHLGTLSRLRTNKPTRWLLSLRMAIFMRVYNKEVLKCIIGSENESLDYVYDPKEHYQHPDVSSPYSGPGPNFFWMEFSTRELAKFRLEEIKKNEKKFGSTY